MNMLVLCFSSVSWLDFTAAKQLENLFDTYGKAGITLVVAGATGELRFSELMYYLCGPKSICVDKGLEISVLFMKRL